jgi:hypothetical protein
VLRRPLLVATAVLVALALVPASLAAVVHVRVEGKTQTLFGATEPRASGANALAVLESASLAGELYYHVATASFGKYVDQIGRYPATKESGWVFKVNGVSPPVGADQVQLHDGDTVLWYYATFGPAGGPPTLELRRTGRNCYAVVQQDDAGKATPAANVTLTFQPVLRTKPHVLVIPSGGKGCVGPHVGTVRATAPGTVRSNAVR